MVVRLFILSNFHVHISVHMKLIKIFEQPEFPPPPSPMLPVKSCDMIFPVRSSKIDYMHATGKLGNVLENEQQFQRYSSFLVFTRLELLESTVPFAGFSKRMENARLFTVLSHLAENSHWFFHRMETVRYSVIHCTVLFGRKFSPVFRYKSGKRSQLSYLLKCSIWQKISPVLAYSRFNLAENSHRFCHTNGKGSLLFCSMYFSIWWQFSPVLPHKWKALPMVGWLVV